jgi:hypothetical protein
MMCTPSDDLASELTTSVKYKQTSWHYTPIIEQTPNIWCKFYLWFSVVLLRARLKIEDKNTTYMKDSRTSVVLGSVDE